RGARGRGHGLAHPRHRTHHLPLLLGPRAGPRAAPPGLHERGRRAQPLQGERPRAGVGGPRTGVISSTLHDDGDCRLFAGSSCVHVSPQTEASSLHLPPLRRVAAALRAVLAHGYDAATFQHDAMAGIVVGIVALPLSMALAIASGVPPQHGLYTAIVGGAVIALLGG